MIAWTVIVLCTLVSVELVARLPIGDRVAALRETLARVTATASSTASDHWKQRALSACARRMLADSVMLSLLLLVVLTPFLAAVPLSALAGHGILQPVASAGGIAATSASAAVYAACRARIAR